MELLLAHVAAALLVNASLSGGRLGANGSSIPIDPTIQNTDQQNLNLTVWELHRIYYSAIVKATADATDWPAPSGSTLAAALTALAADPGAHGGHHGTPGSGAPTLSLPGLGGLSGSAGSSTPPVTPPAAGS